MRLGLGSYAFGWAAGVRGYPAPLRPLTPRGLLEKAAALGVRLVQFADNLPLDRLPNDALDELLRCGGDLGIELELGMRGIGASDVHRHLHIATRLGARLLRVVIDTNVHHPSVDEIVATLTEFVPECEHRGITLAIENHDRFRANTLRAILDRVGHPRIGLCFDTANSLGCMEGAGYVLDVLGPHIVNVHIKDVTVRRQPHAFGFVVEGRPAGEGQLDIPDLVARLRGLGRNLNAILELWPPPDGTPEATIEKENAWVAQSVRYLRQFISE